MTRLLVVTGITEPSFGDKSGFRGFHGAIAEPGVLFYGLVAGMGREIEITGAQIIGRPHLVLIAGEFAQVVAKVSREGS
jgi:hypothetical protein